MKRETLQAWRMAALRSLFEAMCRDLGLKTEAERRAHVRALTRRHVVAKDSP